MDTSNGLQSFYFDPFRLGFNFRLSSSIFNPKNAELNNDIDMSNILLIKGVQYLIGVMVRRLVCCRAYRWNLYIVSIIIVCATSGG